MSPSNAVLWLEALAEASPGLPTVRHRRPYWSERLPGPPAGASGQLSLEATVRRIKAVLDELLAEHYFAEALGYDCVDGSGDPVTSPSIALEDRLGKGATWTAPADAVTRDDLFDMIEVFDDLASRPTRMTFHSFSGCGWHPLAFARRAGQEIYRFRVNQVLDRSELNFRIAENGPDRGRIVVVGDDELETLMVDTVASSHDTRSLDAVQHAIELFRDRHGNRESKRSAVVSLARVLEERRSLLKADLLSKDEGALFDIANNYDIRHRNAGQRDDYRVEFLDWIFAWYLVTIQLTDRLLTAEGDT